MNLLGIDVSHCYSHFIGQTTTLEQARGQLVGKYTSPVKIDPVSRDSKYLDTNKININLYHVISL